MSILRNVWSQIINLVITLLLWAYFLFAWLLLFSPLYLAVCLFSSNRERAFQALNHCFFRGFFRFAGFLISGLTLRVHPIVLPIRSSIIICNHISYLDPILLISLFKNARTIVKSDFFKMPVFGSVLRASGYIPSKTGGALTTMMINSLESMKDYLAAGGNLFVFPEGTRSHDGKLGGFNKGAFRIAKYCRAPIRIIAIKNSNRLFAPGKFIFNTREKNTIEVSLIKSMTPNYEDRDFSIQRLKDEIRTVLQTH